MNQKSLSKWLKIILVGTALCGLVVYCFVIPECGKSLIASYPEFSNRYWPWLVFIWVSGLPCYAVLVLGWMIASNIGRDKSFSGENARYMKIIAWLAAGDSIYFFMGNVALLFLNMSHPGVALLFMIVVFAGAAVAIAAAVLSRLIRKAAGLQEQSDLTI